MCLCYLRSCRCCPDTSARSVLCIDPAGSTIQTAPTYREPFKKRRCLVPASGWYEWQDLGKGKKKRRIHMRPKAQPFAFAGVWDVWKGNGGPSVTSFAIVTTNAAPSVSAYHTRMPVVLDDSQFDEWMRATPDQAAKLMQPYAGGIDAWEVSSDVGNVRNNRPDLPEPVAL
jgi:putative SOS response-associated peptidase YedK